MLCRRSLEEKDRTVAKLEKELLDKESELHTVRSGGPRRCYSMHESLEEAFTSQP